MLQKSPPKADLSKADEPRVHASGGKIKKLLISAQKSSLPLCCRNLTGGFQSCKFCSAGRYAELMPVIYSGATEGNAVSTNPEDIGKLNEEITQKKSK